MFFTLINFGKTENLCFHLQLYMYQPNFLLQYRSNKPHWTGGEHSKTFKSLGKSCTSTFLSRFIMSIRQKEIQSLAEVASSIGDLVNNNSPIQDYIHPDNQTQPTL